MRKKKVLSDKEFWEEQKSRAEIDLRCAKNLLRLCEEKLKSPKKTNY